MNVCNQIGAIRAPEYIEFEPRVLPGFSKREILICWKHKN